MKLSSTVSQNVRLFVTAAVISVGAMGCGGSNDAGGTAGTGGGGTGGGGTGGGGTSGTACTLAQVNAIFTTTSANASTGCTVIGACHDNAGAAAGLDLTAGDAWQTKLVGKAPSATAGSSGNMSKCANMNLVYLKAGSNPAEGLLIDKLNPATAAPCGLHMPNLGVNLSATQFACVRSYLTTLTSP